MTHSTYMYESKLRSVVECSMHPCPGNLVAVVYYAWVAHSFSAEINVATVDKTYSADI